MIKQNVEQQLIELNQKLNDVMRIIQTEHGNENVIFNATNR